MKTRSSKGRAGALCCGLRRLRFEALEDRRLLDGAVGQQAIELFNVSPALFVENQGQWADESVRFVHQGDGVNVAMTDTGPVFQLFRSEPIPTSPLPLAGEGPGVRADLPPSKLEKIEKLEQLRILEAGRRIVVGVVDEPTFGIDTPEDYRAFVDRYRGHEIPTA